MDQDEKSAKSALRKQKRRQRKMARKQRALNKQFGSPKPDGSLTKDIMPDFLHLSAAGYQIWADAIGPKLADLMK